MNERIVASSSFGGTLGKGGGARSEQAAHIAATNAQDKLRIADFDSTTRPQHNAKPQSIFPIMAHNNGMVPRPGSRGVAQASATFAPKMTGAELAAFVPHRPARPE